MRHSHQCASPLCATVWEHDDVKLLTSEAVDAAHACPACGETQYSQHHDIPLAPWSRCLRKRPHAMEDILQLIDRAA